MYTLYKQAGHYATVNGLRMYYEIHGGGMPLVLIHGGGSTIMSTFGRILPELAKTHQVIAVELQAHGHTPDIDRPLSFEQDADDVAALLEQLHVGKADILGFSNGGTTALQIAVRHPALVNKLVLASATYKRDGMQPGFFEGMQHASMENMPQPLKDDGDAEVIRAEHALALSRTLPNARLAILPSGHGDYIGEICAADKDTGLPVLVTAMIVTFLRG